MGPSWWSLPTSCTGLCKTQKQPPGERLGAAVLLSNGTVDWRLFYTASGSWPPASEMPKGRLTGLSDGNWNGVDGIYLVSTKIPLSQHGLHVAQTVRGPGAEKGVPQASCLPVNLPVLPGVVSGRFFQFGWPPSAVVIGADLYLGNMAVA